jgi:hypothetical protein
VFNDRWRSDPSRTINCSIEEIDADHVLRGGVEKQPRDLFSRIHDGGQVSVVSSRLKRPVAQQNTVKRNGSNQDDKNRYHEGDGPHMRCPGRTDFVQKTPVLPSSGRQCQSA